MSEDVQGDMPQEVAAEIANELAEQAPEAEAAEGADLDAIWDNMQTDSGKTRAELEGRETPELKQDPEEAKQISMLEEAVREVSEEETEDDYQPIDEANEESEDSIDEIAEDIEKIDIRFGEDLYHIPEDATIDVKVDGEMQTISLKDFKNGISGQKAIAQRFTELSKQKAELDAAQADLQDSQSQLTTLINEGRAAEAMAFVFDKAGLHPEVGFTKLFEQVLPHLKKFAMLTPEQRQLYQEKLAAEKYRMEAESARTQAEQLQAQQEQLRQAKEVQGVYGLSESEYAYLQDALSKEMEQGLLPKEEITPKKVGSYYKLILKESWASKALESVNPEFKNDRQLISDVTAMVAQIERQGYKVSQEHVMQLVQEAYAKSGMGQPKQVAGKPTKMPPKVAPKAPQGKVSKGNNAPRPGASWLDNFNAELQGTQSDEDLQKVLNKWKT